MQFSVKVMYFLTFGIDECNKPKAKDVCLRKKELQLLYNKMVSIIELKKADDNPSPNFEYFQHITLVY